ncbi:MAG: hypothetical protein ACOYN0_11650 [Phycisphaerales bacterium]
MQSQQPSLDPSASRARRPQGHGAVLFLLGVLYAVALALSFTLIARQHLELGVVGILLVLTTAPIAFISAVMLVAGDNGALAAKMDDVVRSMREMSGQSALSDDARRILNRGTEREILCRAIEEDISAQNWDAAMVLVRELADNFGYRQDAEQFRRRIQQACAQTLEAQVNEAIAYLDGLIIQRRWDDAFADAARLQRLYPDSARVEGLRNRVNQARLSYKDDLERKFLEATSEGRADEALSLLKELDGYLGPQEAEPLRELARGVIGKARENLGVRFKLAVRDRRWREAAAAGEQIIRDFPNTRMAAEVREVIDGVRSRATQAG